MWWLFVVLPSFFVAQLLFLRYKFRGTQWSGRHSARGKTILVTGANSGIGYALTAELAMRGADEVILACRSRERAEKAREEMVEAGADGSRLSIEIVNLSSFSSVDQFVKRLQRTHRTIDVFICNAGVLHADGLTEDGIETMLQANFLGHFLMVERLKANLKRVIFVSSVMHTFAKDVDLTRKLDNSMTKYNKAKLAEVAYAKKLSNEGMEAYSCNPGVVHTNILQSSWMSVFDKYLSPLLAFIMKSPLEGAQTPLKLTLVPADQLQYGRYYSDCELDKESELLRDTATIEGIMEQSRHLVRDFM